MYVLLYFVTMTYNYKIQIVVIYSVWLDNMNCYFTMHAINE